MSSIIYHLSTIIYHLSYIIYNLSSIIYYISSVIYYLLSIIYHLLSIIYHLLSIIYHLSSIIYHLSSFIYHISSTVLSSFIYCFIMKGELNVTEPGHGHKVPEQGHVWPDPPQLTQTNPRTKLCQTSCITSLITMFYSINYQNCIHNNQQHLKKGEQSLSIRD
jgi:hypothetical protein